MFQLEQGTTRHTASADGLGSLVLLTTASGTVAERYSYDPFGLPTITNSTGTVISTSAVGNPVLFTGREWEPEVGIYYYRARFYHPGVGRFLSRDPIGYVDGLNLYAYVGNNPLNWRDPLGLLTQQDLDLIVGNTPIGAAILGELRARGSMPKFHFRQPGPGYIMGFSGDGGYSPCQNSISLPDLGDDPDYTLRSALAYLHELWHALDQARLGDAKSFPAMIDREMNAYGAQAQFFVQANGITNLRRLPHGDNRNRLANPASFRSMLEQRYKDVPGYQRPKSCQ